MNHESTSDKLAELIKRQEITSHAIMQTKADKRESVTKYLQELQDLCNYLILNDEKDKTTLEIIEAAFYIKNSVNESIQNENI